MYTDKDFSDAGSALKKFSVLFCLYIALTLSGVVAALLTRVELLLYISVGLLVVGATFLWGNFGARLMHWNRFLNDMRGGLERRAEGVIASIEEQESQKEGLEFRALRLMTGEETDKAGGRLLYVDSTRFPLPAGPGQKVACSLFGNYIKDMTLLEEE